jgi:CRP-like cAMP-binding protein
MTIEDDIAFLERIAILRQLGAPALRILAIGAENYRVDQGQILFAAGEATDGAYIVQEGSFTLLPEAGGEAAVVAGPGTLLGESALLAETRRPATATARENAMVLRISRAMFLKMLESYPDAAERLREIIAARTNDWARDMENIRAALVADDKPQ